MMMNKDLLQEVKKVVSEVDKTHKYSMSKIYGTYNKVFNTNEQPQACSSCLIRKVKDLKTWVEQQETDYKEVKKAKPKSRARSTKAAAK